jgi:DNA-binding CsgD family transcriptional regulator
VEAAGEEGKPFLFLGLAGAAAAARTVGDAQSAYAISERIIELNRESPDNLMVGMQLFIHGFLAIALGKYDVAHAHLDEALRYAREADDPYRIAIIRNAMGDLARCEQRFAQAVSFYEEGLALFRELGTGRDTPNTERALAYACLRLGDTQRAHALVVQSLEGQRAQDNRLGIAQGLLGLAALAAVVGLPAASARLYGFVSRYREGITIMLEPTYEADKLDYEHYEALVHAALSDEEFEEEQAKGRLLSMEQAIEYALSLPVPSLEGMERVTELTEREREVAVLIACGLSNGQIADELVVSKRTVEKHIANILSKLGFTNRAQIVRWAIQNGLTDAARVSNRRIFSCTAAVGPKQPLSYVCTKKYVCRYVRTRMTARSWSATLEA